MSVINYGLGAEFFWLDRISVLEKRWNNPDAMRKGMGCFGMIHFTPYTIRKAQDDPTLVLEELIDSYKIKMG